MRKPQSEKIEMKKGPWSVEEDKKLIDYMHKHGQGKWNTITKNAGLQRCGKSCRLRWINYLRPDIKRGRFSDEEENTIIRLHSILGNKWSSIASHLPGRTDNEIKNYWNTHIRKRIKQGIDPVTHVFRRNLIQLCSFFKIQNIAGTNPNNISNLFPFSDASYQSKPLEHHPELFLHHENEFNGSSNQYQYEPLIQACSLATSFDTNDFHMQADMEPFSPMFNFTSQNFVPSLSHASSMINNQTTDCMGNNLISPSDKLTYINESPYLCQLPYIDQSQNFQFPNNAQKVEYLESVNYFNTCV